MSFTFRMAWDWSLFIDRKGKGGGGWWFGGYEGLLKSIQK